MPLDDERPGRPPGDGVAGGRAPGGVPALGLDVGSTNVKAVLVLLDPDGDAGAGTVTEVAARAARTPEHPDRLVGVVLDLVRSVLDGRPAPQVVGLASMAETGAPLGRDGAALTDLLRWDGARGAQDADALAASLGRDALFAATGVRVSPKVPMATWARLRRTQPEVWRRTARWAGAADLVCLAMTGRLVTDHTLAGRTMAYRLPVAGSPLPDGFDAELLAAVGLRPEQLPAVARPGEAAGTVVDPAFVAAGLTAGTPVVVAGHDHPVGAWGAGMRRPGDRADSVGTAEAVMTVLGDRDDRTPGHPGRPGRPSRADGPDPVDRAAVAAQGMSLVRTVSGRHEAVVAGSPAAGAMVRWWLATVLPGRTVEGVLARAVAHRVVAGERADGPTGVLVLPYLGGRQSPAPDPTASVRVLDAADRDLTRAALAVVPGTDVPRAAAVHTVAMLEGLALQARWMLAEANRLAGGDGGHGTGDGPPAPLLVLGGAGAANRVWMGLKAAVTGADVHLADVAEPVATSAAMLAAERLGVVPPGRLRLPARVLRAPVDRRRYDRTSERFVAAATGRTGRPHDHPDDRRSGRDRTPDRPDR